MESASKDIGRLIESAVPSVKVGETTFIGALAEDETACYAGLLQKVRTQAGTDKIQIAIVATTVAKGKMVYAMRYSIYDPSEVTAMLAAHQQTLAVFLERNK